MFRSPWDTPNPKYLNHLPVLECLWLKYKGASHTQPQSHYSIYVYICLLSSFLPLTVINPRCILFNNRLRYHLIWLIRWPDLLHKVYSTSGGHWHCYKPFFVIICLQYIRIHIFVYSEQEKWNLSGSNHQNVCFDIAFLFGNGCDWSTSYIERR